MPKPHFQFSQEATAEVDRACEIARNIFSSCRGQYDTEKQCVDAVARQTHLTPSVLRSLLYPSKRRKDVSHSVWTRLIAAYGRHLERQLHRLEDEIARLSDCGSADTDVLRLLHDAEALAEKIRAVAETLPAAGEAQPGTDQL